MPSALFSQSTSPEFRGISSPPFSLCSRVHPLHRRTPHTTHQTATPNDCKQWVSFSVFSSFLRNQSMVLDSHLDDSRLIPLDFANKRENKDAVEALRRHEEAENESLILLLSFILFYFATDTYFLLLRFIDGWGNNIFGVLLKERETGRREQRRRSLFCLLLWLFQVFFFLLTCKMGYL